MSTSIIYDYLKSRCVGNIIYKWSITIDCRYVKNIYHQTQLCRRKIQIFDLKISPEIEKCKAVAVMDVSYVGNVCA